jgi:hypothetical protein
VPTKYVEQEVSDPVFDFSLDFDPHSYGYVVPTTPGEEEVDLAGAQLGTRKHVVIRVVKLDAADIAGLNATTCLSAPAPGTSSQGNIFLFRATVMGQTPAVCGNETGANFFFEANNAWYEVQFGVGDSNTLLPISNQVMETVANSFRILG